MRHKIIRNCKLNKYKNKKNKLPLHAVIIQVCFLQYPSMSKLSPIGLLVIATWHAFGKSWADPNGNTDATLMRTAFTLRNSSTAHAQLERVHL